jgi:hypothetical protein
MAAAAAMGTLTVLFATGCSFSMGEVEKKDEVTAGTEAPATGSTDGPSTEKEPTAGRTPTGDKPAAPAEPTGGKTVAPDTTGVNEGGAVHKARVALTISDKIAARTGKRPTLVTCPAHLPARIGASIRCQVTTDGDTQGVTVTTVSVNGKQVNFRMKVADSPQ